MTGVAITLCVLSFACVIDETLSSGNCELTILENLEDVIDLSSSNVPHNLAKEILKTFFLRVKGHSRFNITKERNCKEKQLTFEQFLDRTSLHFSGRSVCGNSFFKISVATIVTFLHLERFICSENKATYQAYHDELLRMNIMHMVSRHIHHDRNWTDVKDRQCLNEARLQKMVDIIRRNPPRFFPHQHHKRQETSEVLSTAYSTIPDSSVDTTTWSDLKEQKTSSVPNQQTSDTIDMEFNITTVTPEFVSIISHFNGSETHCFLKEGVNKNVCIGLNAEFNFTAFYCMKSRRSDLYKCARHRGNVGNKTKNNILILVLMSSFNEDNMDKFRNLVFLPPLKHLAWKIKYVSYRPLKIELDKASRADEQTPLDRGPSTSLPAKPTQETSTDTITESFKGKNNTVQKHGYQRKGNQHEDYYRVTEKEATSALVVFAVLKQHLLQPRNLPCPDEVLQRLYADCIPPKSQVLTVNDIQKRFQRLIHNTNKPSSHEHHDHHKRSLLQDKDDSFSIKKQHYDPQDPVKDNNDPRYRSKEGHSRYHSFNYNHNHTSYSSHDHSSSDSSESNHNHYYGHSHDRPSEYNHVSNHEHSHAQQIHGHQNECPRLVPSLRGTQRDHFGELKHYDNWTLDDIPYIYFGSRASFDVEDLREMAPGLLWLILKDGVSKHEEHSAVTYVHSYGMGTLCIVFLSLASVLGAIFIKISGTKKKAYLLSFLLALSVGCLLGDAILHLVPSTLGQHDHDNLGKLVILLATMYGFFLIQLIVSLFHKEHDHSKIVIKDSNNPNVDSTKNEILEVENKARKNIIVLNNITSSEDSPMERQESNESQKDLTIEECPSESNVSTTERDIIPVVWMVIIGDCVHNFADGLAIGATFTQSLTEGLSTALAVLCHEIPHELGDFAILLAAGFTVKKAIVVNLLSSLTAFVGLYIGISVGEDFRIWIIAAGSGMFLYISMVTMIPELVRIFKANTCKEMFLALNLGYILGAVAMLFLAIYEEDLKIT